MHSPAATPAARLHQFDYSKEWLRADVAAGLTTAAVVFPKSIAYAAIAGLPPEAGLYSAITPMLAYALLGTSRVLSVSSTSAIAIMTAAALGDVVRVAGAAQLTTAVVTLSLMVAAMLLLAGVLRLGLLASFISDPVLTGFKAGIGVLVIADQLPKLLGVHIVKDGFFSDLASIVRHVPDASFPTLALALATLVLLVILEKRAPRVPGPLVAVMFGLAASALFGFDRFGIETIGAIRTGAPALTLPDPALIVTLWPAAAGIAFMSFTESIATGRAFAGAGEPRPRANRELIALGIANAAGGFTGAMAAGGGASQTTLNSHAGAKTQVASVITASVILAVLLAFASIVALLPLATLAAVIVATCVGLVSPREFRAIGAVRSTELCWAIAAFAGVVLLGSLQGIAIAVFISICTLIYQANRPPVYALVRKPGSNVFRPVSLGHPLDEASPGVLILRTEGRMHFANAQAVGDQMWPLIHATRPRVVILDCSAIPDIEYTALRMLTEAEDKLRKSGVTLCLASLNPRALRVILASPLGERLGRDRTIFTLDEAVARCAEQPTILSSHAIEEST